VAVEAVGEGERGEGLFIGGMRRWGGGTVRWPVSGSAGAINGVLAARGRRGAVARVEASHVGGSAVRPQCGMRQGSSGERRG
jgi:hypothetical protein